MGVSGDGRRSRRAGARRARLLRGRPSKRPESTGALFQITTPTTALGFLEVSLGDYAAAVATLQHLISSFDRRMALKSLWALTFPMRSKRWPRWGASTKPNRSSPRSNATACATTGPGCWRWVHEAEARCWQRGAILEAAEQVAREAMDQHRRIPMPFEKARTQLLLGQLQRRRRHKHAAEARCARPSRPSSAWARRCGRSAPASRSNA